MAALTQSQKDAILKYWAATVSHRREAFALTKTDAAAAVTAVDNWQDSNATSFNNTLPAAAKANLTAAQKSELFNLVSKVRYSGSI